MSIGQSSVWIIYIITRYSLSLTYISLKIRFMYSMYVTNDNEIFDDLINLNK